jgi:serine/threonine protein kinase
VSGLFGIVAVIGGLLLAMVALYALWLLAKAIGRGFGWFFRKLFALIGGLMSDALRLAGHLLTAACYVPAIALSILFSRWSNANHYGRALEAEAMGAVNCLYRLAIGHIAKFFGLTPLIEGLERRVPDVIARAPGADRPSGGANAFEGWVVNGSLQGGGSGGKLWLASPTNEKRRALAAAGRPCPERVVIKSFSLEEGSTLPQIVRENRALAAARDLGLVIEHELTAQRFHYVMPYVPGEDLGLVTARLHARSGPAGLDDAPLHEALGFASDLLLTLDRFHSAGLWHKDVKPSNILVSEGRVHLVDLGLITPLASAMTLTTHGTEYFRDPEMVKLALKGVKVHEVDGVKFDVYGAGAVLYSMIENSFPAHGSLSRISRRCPEAVRWIVRRAMADMSNRYGSAREMLADLQVVAQAPDPFAVRPAELPSLKGGQAPVLPATDDGLSPRPAPAPSGSAPRSTYEEPRRRRRREPVTGFRKVVRYALLGGLVMFFLPVLTSWLTLGAPASMRFRSPHVSSKQGDNSAVRSVADVTTVPPPAPADDGIERLEPVSLDHLPAAAASPAVHPAAPSAGLVLLLDDLPAAADAALGEWATKLQERLEKAHFAVIGGRDPAADAPLAVTGLDDEHQVALLAGARSAVGLSDPSDEDAALRLAQWLGDQDARLDAIVWIGRADPGQPVRTRVVARKLELATKVKAATR